SCRLQQVSVLQTLGRNDEALARLFGLEFAARTSGARRALVPILSARAACLRLLDRFADEVRSIRECDALKRELGL
ncbi:MAG TPA: hypothetical protein VD902_03345, partial [Symbiobacteriaceae bacterium]|nr:hypothetical protein [Symbiobacteriaceae bacterium]